MQSVKGLRQILWHGALTRAWTAVPAICGASSCQRHLVPIGGETKNSMGKARMYDVSGTRPAMTQARETLHLWKHIAYSGLSRGRETAWQRCHHWA